MKSLRINYIPLKSLRAGLKKKREFSIKPTTQPQNYQRGESKRGEWGLIKVKKQVDFKIHFM